MNSTTGNFSTLSASTWNLPVSISVSTLNASNEYISNLYASNISVSNWTFPNSISTSTLYASTGYFSNVCTDVIDVPSAYLTTYAEESAFKNPNNFNYGVTLGALDYADIAFIRFKNINSTNNYDSYIYSTSGVSGISGQGELTLSAANVNMWSVKSTYQTTVNGNFTTMNASAINASTWNLPSTISTNTVNVSNLNASIGNIKTANISTLNASTWNFPATIGTTTLNATIGNFFSTANAPTGNFSTLNASTWNLPATISATTMNASTGNFSTLSASTWNLPATISATTLNASTGNFSTLSASTWNLPATISATTMNASTGNFSTINASNINTNTYDSLSATTALTLGNDLTSGDLYIGNGTMTGNVSVNTTGYCNFDCGRRSTWNTSNIVSYSTQLGSNYYALAVVTANRSTAGTTFVFSPNNTQVNVSMATVPVGLYMVTVNALLESYTNMSALVNYNIGIATSTALPMTNANTNRTILSNDNGAFNTIPSQTTGVIPVTVTGFINIQNTGNYLAGYLSITTASHTAGSMDARIRTAYVVKIA